MSSCRGQGLKNHKGWCCLSVAAIGTLVLVWGVYPWGYVRWQVYAARQALSQADPQRAIVALRRAERIAPDGPEILYLLGRSLRRADQPVEAIAYLRRAADAGWPAAELREQQVLMLAQAGSVDQVQMELGEVFRKGCSDDRAEEIYEAQAKGHLSAYRFQDALLCIDYWLQWRPQARLPRVWRADVWERVGRLPDALREYRVLIDQNPSDVESRARLANVLLATDDVEGAMKEYDTCLAARSGDAPALLGAAKCRRRLGHLSGVKESLLGLLNRDLTNGQRGEVLYELGEIALYDQEYEKAVEYLTQVRKFDPMHATVSYPLARAYARLGKSELAEEINHQGAETQRRAKRMAEVTGQVIDHPQDPELRYEAGMILMAEGLKKEGVAWLQTALSCDPGHRKAHEALAEYYAQSGDIRNATLHRQGLERRADHSTTEN